MSENKRISPDKAVAFKAGLDESFRQYVKSLAEPGVVPVESGLAQIIDKSLLTENSGSQGWCALPYKLTSHNNKGGCPNRGATPRSLRGFEADVVGRVIRECPPTSFLARTIFDLDRPTYVIYTVFPVGEYAEQLRKTSKKLTTPGGWYNVRYWQNVAREWIYERASQFLRKFPGAVVDLCPEAHGVDLRKVMINMGIELQFGCWPPEHSVENVRYQICLGGYPKDSQRLIEAGMLGRKL